MSRSARLALLGLAGGITLLATGAAAAAEKPCGLARIEPAGSGVTLHFTGPRQVVLMHEAESELYVIDSRAAEADGSDTQPRRRHALPLKDGQQAVVRNAGNERCSIEVAHRGGRIGVEVAVSGPGAAKSTPATRYEKFLPAE